MRIVHWAAMFIPLLALTFTPAWAGDEPTAAGKKASEWLTLLRTSEKAETRRTALLALEIIGPTPRGVLGGVNSALEKDNDERVRTSAAQLLGKLAPKAQDGKVDFSDSVEALSQALKSDKSDKVREAAAEALGRSAGDAKFAVPTLATALKDKDQRTREAAAVALGRLGADARDALPQLLETLKDKNADRFTRGYAGHALSRIGPEEAGKTVPVMAAVASDGSAEPGLRKAVVESLTLLGKDARQAVPVLGGLLKEKDVRLRQAAAIALDGMGADAKEALSALRAAAKDEDRSVRAQSLHALGNLGKEAPEAVVPTLVESLKDTVVEVRIAGIVALGNIGPPAKASLPALQNARRDGQSAVREAAAEALKRIQ